MKAFACPVDWSNDLLSTPRDLFNDGSLTPSVRWVTAIVRAVSEPLPIAVLVSGTGTNLQALLDSVHGREAQIVGVASRVAGAPALQRAIGKGVPTAVFARSEYPDRKVRDEAMADWLEERSVRLVVLAGYMELL